MKVQEINDTFAISQHIYFESGPGEMPLAQIRNRHASATVSLYGAQVTAYQPQGETPVIWLSRCSLWQKGKAIRGGIPLCWPWFGPDPSNSGKPQHGFVRTMLWTVLGTDVLEDGATLLCLGLDDSPETRLLWPHAFSLQLWVTVGRTLDVELIVHNPGSTSFGYSGGLHSYFGVDDVTAIAIHGLDGTAYLDKVDGGQRKQQAGAVTIAMETDRIYVDTATACTIDDPGLNRRIVVAKSGSTSTVVWNPWVEKAQQLHDMCDDDYMGMVCLETTNAGPDMVDVAPGASARLRATISVEPRADA